MTTEKLTQDIRDGLTDYLVRDGVEVQWSGNEAIVYIDAEVDDPVRYLAEETTFDVTEHHTDAPGTLYTINV